MEGVKIAIGIDEAGDIALNVEGVAAGFGQNALLFIQVILIAAIVIGLVWFAIWWSRFKFTVVIREVTHSRRVVYTDKAKIKKKEGVEYWYLRGRKVFLTIPPPEALEVTKKGKFFAECYHDGEAGFNTGYYWIKDDAADIKKPSDDTFKPLPTERQSALINRIRRAEARKGKGLFEQLIPIVMSVSMILIVAIPFMFYGELTKSNKEVMQDVARISAANAETTQQLSTAIKVITGKLEREELVINQDLPLDDQVDTPPPDAEVLA